MTAPRDWTAAEDRFLVRASGSRPLEWIAQDLRRDAADVLQECERLQVSPDFPFSWCVCCSRWRLVMYNPYSKGGKGCAGFCYGCYLRESTRTIEGRIAAALAEAPADIVEKYSGTEAKRESLRTEKPPDRRGFTDSIAYAAALEDWENSLALRIKKATQKRYERIRRALAKARAREPDG